MLDVDFFSCYFSKVCFQLNQLFDEKLDAVCCFLHQESEHKGRDWRSGETWSISLSHNIYYNERIKIGQLKAKSLPVPVEFSTPEFDLSVPDT